MTWSTDLWVNQTKNPRSLNIENMKKKAEILLRFAAMQMRQYKSRFQWTNASLFLCNFFWFPFGLTSRRMMRNECSMRQGLHIPSKNRFVPLICILKRIRPPKTKKNCRTKRFLLQLRRVAKNFRNKTFGWDFEFLFSLALTQASDVWCFNVVYDSHIVRTKRWISQQWKRRAFHSFKEFVRFERSVCVRTQWYHLRKNVGCHIRYHMHRSLDTRIFPFSHNASYNVRYNRWKRVKKGARAAICRRKNL